VVKLIDKGELEKEQKVVQSEQIFVVKLPSKGKHGYTDTIKCRPLKVKDVKALVADPLEDEVEYVSRLIDVIQGTIVEGKINLRELSMPDFKKVLLAHRVNSIGAVFELGFYCGCKDELQTVKYDLMQLDEKEISDSYVEPVQLNGFSVRFPRVYGYIPEGKKSFSDVTDFDVLSSAVVGKDVEELTLKEMKEVQAFVEKWDGSYGVQEDVDIPCKYCGKKVRVGIPFFLFIQRW
jgi:putative transposon-encoded protein